MQVERGISVTRIRECFDIDPSTGVMVWKWRPGVPRFINVRHAGKPAAKGRNSSGYLRVKVDGVRFVAHRVAYALYHGAWPDGDIDHINGKTDDNRKCNLRVVTHQGNLRNSGVSVASTSGIVGVGYHKASGKYRAHIGVDGKQVDLGLHLTVEAAADARRRAEQEYGFHEGHGKRSSINKAKARPQAQDHQDAPA